MALKFLIILLITVVSCSKNGENQIKKQEVIDEKNEIEFEALSVRTSLVEGVNTIPNSSLDFATLQPKQSASQDLIIINSDSSSLVFGASDINATDISPFVMTESCSNKTLARNRSCKLSFSIVNNPNPSEIVLTKSLTIKGSTIQLTANLAADTTPVNQPIVSLIVSPLILDFGSMKSGETKELSVAITNKGSSSQTISPPILSNPKISLTSNTCSSLARNRSCSMKFSYAASTDESISQQSFTSIANNDIKYSVLIQSPTVSQPEVLNVNPSISSSSLNLTVPQIHNGTLSFSNSGTLILPSPVQLVASPSTGFSVNSVSCSGGLARGRTCSASYSLNSAALPEGTSQIQIRLQSGSLASNPHTINLSIPVTGPIVSCTSLNPTQLQSLGYTTTHIASVSGNTPNCVIETCVPYYERAGGTEAKTCNPKACNGLDSQELIDLDYIDDASGTIGYNPQEYLSGIYPNCSISCPSGYEVNPSNPKRCQPISNVVTFQAVDTTPACSSLNLQACDGVQQISKTYICEKFVNSVKDNSYVSNSADCSLSNTSPVNCLSPMGTKSVNILNLTDIIGTKQVSCLEGSSIESLVANSVSCNSGYVSVADSCVVDNAPLEPTFAIFSATVGNIGTELFRLSNDQVSLITSGLSQKTKSSAPLNAVAIGNDLYLLAHTEEANGNREIYKISAGSSTPVRMTNTENSSITIGSLTKYQNKLYYYGPSQSNPANYACSVYDPSTSQTIEFLQNEGYCTYLEAFGELLIVNSKIRKLNSDGISASPVLFEGSGQIIPSNMAISSFNNKVYFTSSTPATGQEIFVYTGGVSPSVSLAKDITVGTSGTSISSKLVAAGNSIFYSSGTSGGSNSKAYRYNLQTNTVTEIISNNARNFLTFAVVGDVLYFEATTGGDTELHGYNLTTGVLTKVVNIRTTGNGGASSIITDGTNIFFSASDGNILGTELRKYNPTTQTVTSFDINSVNVSGAGFKKPIIKNNHIYAEVSAPNMGTELLKFNLADETYSIINICEDPVGENTCPGLSSDNFPFAIGDSFIFVNAFNPLIGGEIAKISVVDNAVSFVDINTGLFGSQPGDRIIVDNKVYFAGSDSTGVKLFVQDLNQPPGTHQVINIPNSTYSYQNPRQLLDTPNNIYFKAYESQGNSYIYKYNKSTEIVTKIDYNLGNDVYSYEGNSLLYHNGILYAGVSNGILEYNEIDNTFSTNGMGVWNHTDDTFFDQMSWEQSNCFTSPDEPYDLVCNPLTEQSYANYPTKLKIFNNKLYVSAEVHYWDSMSGGIVFKGRELFSYDLTSKTMTKITNYLSNSGGASGMGSGYGFDPIKIDTIADKLIVVSRYFDGNGLLVIDVSNNINYSMTNGNFFASISYPSHIFIEEINNDVYVSISSTAGASYRLYKVYNDTLSIEALVDQVSLANIFSINNITFNDLGKIIKFNGAVYMEASTVELGHGLIKLDSSFNYDSFISAGIGEVAIGFGGLFSLQDKLYFSPIMTNNIYSIFSYDPTDSQNSSELLYNSNKVQIQPSLNIIKN